MRAFIYQIGLNWKLNLRSKELLVHYYVVPLVFYCFMGVVFISILPDADKTIIQVMSVFAITMGGVLGSPYPLVEFYHSDIKKAYQVGKIPLWTVARQVILFLGYAFICDEFDNFNKCPDYF